MRARATKEAEQCLVDNIVVDDTRANLTWTVKSPRPVSSAQRS